jgi:peptidoglycan/LPS O-acetylase OafA/YrhL
LAVAWFIGPGLLSYFPIWLLGLAVALLYAHRPGPVPWVPALIGGSGAILAVVLALVRAGRIPDLPGDYVVALAAAFFIASLLPADGSWAARTPGSLYVRVAHWLAGFSYTLYLTHLPILIFLRAMVIIESRWQPTLFRLLEVTGIALLTLACCYAISLATEAHTAQVRRALLRSSAG